MALGEVARTQSGFFSVWNNEAYIHILFRAPNMLIGFHVVGQPNLVTNPKMLVSVFGGEEKSWPGRIVALFLKPVPSARCRNVE